MGLARKRILITGVLNRNSIAFGIAKACIKAGYEVALTYQNDVIRTRVLPLCDELGVNVLLELDVTREASVSDAFTTIKSAWGNIDGLVHAIAFVDTGALKGPLQDISLEQFQDCMNISCYSLISIMKFAAPLMSRGASVLTLTSLGSQRVLKGYGAMGIAKSALEATVRYLAHEFGCYDIRINAISAGPLKTVSTARVPGFNSILEWNRNQSMLRRNISSEEIANAAVFLLSDASSGVTAEILNVDAGHHAQGMHN